MLDKMAWPLRWCFWKWLTNYTVYNWIVCFHFMLTMHTITKIPCRTITCQIYNFGSHITLTRSLWNNSNKYSNTNKYSIDKNSDIYSNKIISNRIRPRQSDLKALIAYSSARQMGVLVTATISNSKECITEKCVLFLPWSVSPFLVDEVASLKVMTVPPSLCIAAMKELQVRVLFS